MTARRSNFLLRAAVAGIMALMIGAPTPGYVQGCSSGGTSGEVDAEEYCRQYEERVCARDLAARRITMEEHEACLQQIDAACSGFNFGPGCEPTVLSVQACYDALIHATRIGTDETELPECQAVCQGAGGGGEPEGI